MTAADDAHAELMRALLVERFTHLPENVPAKPIQFRAGRDGRPEASTDTPLRRDRAALRRLTEATKEAS